MKRRWNVCWGEIYRNIQTFCFQSASIKQFFSIRKWYSANVFLTPNRNMFAKELRFLKWVFFERNCIVKSVIFFAVIFFIAFEIFGYKFWNKKTLMMSTGTCGLKLCTRNNVFKKKKIANMRFWIIYILLLVSIFAGLL